jgi:signal transduction histidine kinase
MLWIAYLLRVGQVATRMEQLHEERMDERIRIAHALHDTLLQGVLSTSMQLQVLGKQIPPESKPLFGHILERMTGVIEEGRQALRGLRASDSHESLEQAFSEMKKELAGDDVGFNGEFRVIVTGERRPPIPSELRDQIYRIGREALMNAFRHARADNVEVEIEFLRKRLVLRVRDDGRGIDPAVLQLGLDNHFGLPGMRERAESIGGQLRVISRIGAGTEVELLVPLGGAPQFWRAMTISRRPKRRASTE